MSFSDILGSALDGDMYDHPGKVTVMKYAVRKYRDRPALKVGESVTIVRMAMLADNYGSRARVLVCNNAGLERWVNGTDIEPVQAEISPALKRCLEIASEKMEEIAND